MPKKARELGTLEVSRLTKAGLWPVGGVAGLRLQVSDTGARSWILKVNVAGRRREIGLGGFPDVALAGARNAARAVRAKIVDGVDPVAEAKAARSAAIAARLSAVTFAEAAADCIKSQEAGWRNAKHAKQWTATLETYAYPVLGDMLIVRGALWSEFDLDAATWVISAQRMKAAREHRIPLAPAAVKLLRAQPRIAKGKPGHDLVFPAPKGGMLSDMSLAACFKRLNEQGDKPRWLDPRTGEQATPHGTARSTFKDWCAERTSFANEMSEIALAHKVANAVEAAYRRGDMIEKRRRMMVAWATFCATKRPIGANVVPMQRRRDAGG